MSESLHRFGVRAGELVLPSRHSKRINVNTSNRRRNMKIEKWTLGLAAVGLVTLSPALLAQNAPQMVPIQTALTATTISGYVDTSAVWNPGTGNAHPAPYAFNAGKQDGFNLDAVDLKIEKALDDAQWSAGYVLELSYGPDATAIDGGAAPIRQAYVNLRTPVGNGIDWQIGRWDALLGYESSDSYKNPNWTHSYGKTFEPTEDTGLLGSYKFCDAVTFQAGVSDTLTTEGTSVNARSGIGSPVVESKKSVETLLTLTAPDSWGSFKGSTFYAGFGHGQGIYSKDRTEWYLGTTIFTPVKDLTFGASYDLIEHNDLAVPVAIDAGYFEAFAVYGSYKPTDKLTLSTRGEYANGDALSWLTTYGGAGGPTEFDPGFNKVIDVTGTVAYDLWANVISRLELRWDHAADGSSPFGATSPTGSGKKNEVTLAANVIYKF
jgi:hypothetical protein